VPRSAIEYQRDERRNGKAPRGGGLGGSGMVGDPEEWWKARGEKSVNDTIIGRANNPGKSPGTTAMRRVGNL